MAVKCYRNIRTLFTFRGFVKKQGLSPSVEDLAPIKNAALLVQKGHVLWVGKEAKLKDALKKANIKQVKDIDLENKNVFPSFTESHTHLAFGGDRKKEFELKVQGATYQEIQKAGGGISRTVKDTKKTTQEELNCLVQKRALAFKKQGVTLLEVKSGYGQDLDTEIKQLKAAYGIRGMNVVPTYLGLHSYKGDKDAYVKRVLAKDLPKIKEEFPKLNRADLFIEKNFFENKDLKLYAKELQKYKMGFCAHVNQLSHSAGAVQAAQLGAQSIEHGVHLRPKQIEVLSKTHVVANLLPGADFYLNTPYPNARALVEAGVRVSLATDFNPGSSPTKSLGFVGLLARRQMGMSLPEVWCAYTLNASRALGVLDKGALIPGMRAHFFTSDADWSDFFYSVEEHPVERVLL